MQNLVRFLAIFFLIFPLSSLASLSSVAFYYGHLPPVDQLRVFDVVVVNPSDAINSVNYNMPHSNLFAYVSVGEVAESAAYYQQISPQWVIATNKTWHSKVMDQAQPAWQSFFLDHIIAPLWDKGYRGFFLDTLDSYKLAGLDAKEEQQQINGLIQLIRAIKSRYPEAKLILNRGFSLLPTIHDAVFAVAAESLFASWDENKKQYLPVSATNRANLLIELKKVQQLGLPVIVIDYLPPNRRSEALKVAKQISALGMIPWVTDGQLQSRGVGSVSPVARKIFILYTNNEIKPTIFTPSAFLLLALPLEYLGYLPRFQDANMPLPENFFAEDYAGIVVWASPKTESLKLKLHDWVVKHLHDGIPILFMGSFGFDPTQKLLAPFGLNVMEQSEYPKSVHIAKQDKNVVGFEISAYPDRFSFFPIKANNSRVLLQIMNENKQTQDAIAITPWGGYALEPYVSINLPSDENLWVINPLTWLPLVLRLQPFPIPDITTENGRRLMFAHIDGDGFSTKAEWKGGDFAAVEIENRILKRYRIPTTVSVITGTIAANGLNPAYSSQLVEIARRIFALPWVEVASHTYSHPFNWILMLEHPFPSGKYNLPIPNYVFDANVEIAGSADYINKNLVPPGKTCKVLLWSGSANVNENQLSIPFKVNLANLNGGDTHIVSTFPSMTAISPSGRQQGDYFQVYSPITNEEFYTNSWSHPYYGFERVIDTYKLTDSPHRFKPIDIYYHFYSGSKTAALIGLDKVYQWVLSQPVMPIYASEYVAKVLDANAASIARTSDGFQIHTTGRVRELRIPKNWGYPDLERSPNVIGYNSHNECYYLHLGPALETRVILTKEAPKLPYLVDANGRITEFKHENNDILIRLQSDMPLNWKLANMSGCELRQKNILLKGKTMTENVTSYDLQGKDSDELRINCQQH